MKKPEWTVSDVENARYLGVLEFKDDKGEWNHFEVLATPTRIVFGGSCNVGFIESGYLPMEEGDDLDEMLSELLEDLKTYYSDGYEYTTMIICNERM